MKMVSEIPLQCSRVIIPPEGIRQDFALEGNLYKFYNLFERRTVFFFCHLGVPLPIFHTIPKNQHCRRIAQKWYHLSAFLWICSNVLLCLPFCEKI